ncbi:TIGR00282 family metallophosphoesterase [Candidatus Sumerlaeota bacterium]|nr:TIGR00282 family metallophosphoesterase [Candidatus Sumerlaeota bacterium]
MRLLFIGDVFGRPGRRIVKQQLSALRRREEVDFVVANGENASGGSGLTQGNAEELFKAGVDVITGGNHIFQNRDIFKFIDDEARLVRPANYPPHPDLRGQGVGIYLLPGGYQLAVINLMGTVFMRELDNPFHCADEILRQLEGEVKNILVDMHAEATSEKIAMGWHLDGRVTAVLGTHTHVVTADERLLHHGTAYQTDVGMTGPHDSCIGVTKKTIVQGFLSKLPVRHSPATDEVALHATLIEFDPETGRASGIYRIRETED